MHSMNNSRSSGGYYYRLYWAHALTRHYLTTGRKYVLIRKYALNKHMHLLTRLYRTEEACNRVLQFMLKMIFASLKSYPSRRSWTTWVGIGRILMGQRNPLVLVLWTRHLCGSAFCLIGTKGVLPWILVHHSTMQQKCSMGENFIKRYLSCCNASLNHFYQDDKGQCILNLM